MSRAKRFAKHKVRQAKKRILPPGQGARKIKKKNHKVSGSRKHRRSFDVDGRVG
jgi:hypothetical protein